MNNTVIENVSNSSTTLKSLIYHLPVHLWHTAYRLLLFPKSPLGVTKVMSLDNSLNFDEKQVLSQGFLTHICVLGYGEFHLLEV